MRRKNIGLISSTAVFALSIGVFTLYSQDNQADLLYHPDTVSFDQLNDSDIETIEQIKLGLQQAREARDVEASTQGQS